MSLLKGEKVRVKDREGILLKFQGSHALVKLDGVPMATKVPLDDVELYHFTCGSWTPDICSCVFCGRNFCDGCGSLPEGICAACGKKMAEAN